MARGSRGLPLFCPRCPPKHYFGILLAEAIPTVLIKYKGDMPCPNCRTLLIARGHDVQ